MNISLEKAKFIAEGYFNASYFEKDDKLVVLNSETIEKEYGWYFFSQSETYLESKNISDMVLGNAPILVKKNGGDVVQFGTALDIEEYIKMYEDKHFGK